MATETSATLDTTLDSGRISRRGGRLCLDFANTTDWYMGDPPDEHLRSYGDLIAWAALLGVISDTTATHLRDVARHHPGTAEATLARAIHFREAIYRVFSAHASAHAHARPIAAADIALINAEVADAFAHLRIGVTDGAFTWEWTPGDTTAELARMLWPVARSVTDLLVSSELDRVRECAGERCSWLFLDTSRNRSRRWCDMGSCGNRAKARRHYARSREQGWGEQGTGKREQGTEVRG